MRKVLSVIFLILLGALFVGCSNTKEELKKSDKLLVYTSFYTMTDFTKKIGGDKVEVITLLPPGIEVHDWEPSASDMARLEKGKVLIYSGAGMEHWIDKVISSLGNDRLVLVEASKNVPLLTSEEEHEGHNHSHEAHDHGQVDPHVWLNPKNAKLQMEEIKKGLIQADPANADYYEENYKKYAKELDVLDHDLKEMLGSLKKRDIIVSHAAFGYFCAAYDLDQEAIRGISPEEEPSPTRLSELIHFAQEHQVKVIFFEETVSPKVSEVLANEVGAEVMMLNPLENLSEEEIQKGEDYFSVMRKNGQTIQKALLK